MATQTEILFGIYGNVLNAARNIAVMKIHSPPTVLTAERRWTKVMKMAKEQRPIDAMRLVTKLAKKVRFGRIEYDDVLAVIAEAPTVNAVEIPDKEMLRAVKLLLNQYEHSKNSEYVHSPVAHAFFHTWKQLDERRE